MAKRIVCVLGGLSISAAAIFPVANRAKNLRSGDETEKRRIKINEAIKQSRKLIGRLKNEVGAPGIIVGVSVDGEQVWKEGFGYADIENEVEAHEETVMRIASISKSLTAAVVARLWQDGVVDIDKPVQSYVPSFPEKKFGEEKVTITTRLLMCHLSGIRHYSTKKKEESAGSGDGQLEEFYSKERYDSVEKALAIFKDDELLHAPGSKFLYTTYGWTLVSAVMEGATGKTYPQIMRTFLRELGMRRTYLDQPEPIIYGRSKCYSKNKNGRVVNSPYVDNSCKWAGGGFLSTVGDLLKFSNALLFAFQRDGDIEVAKGSYKMVQNSMNSSNSPEMKSQSESSEKRSQDSEFHDADTRVEKMKSAAQKVTSVIGSEVGSATSGLVSGVSSIWNYGSSWIRERRSESSEKKSQDNEFKDANTRVEEMKSAAQKVTSIIGSGLGSATSGLVSGVSSIWNYGSSWIREHRRKISEKESQDNEFKDANTRVEEMKSAAQKVTSIIGSGLGSATSGLVSGASSIWNYGSAWISGGGSESSEKNSQDEKNNAADTTVAKESVSQKVTSVIGSGVGSATSGLVSGASSIWNYGSSWISGGGSESSEKNSQDEKNHDADTTVANKESVSQKVTSVIGSGVGSATSGLVSGASSIWNYGSSWISGGGSESSEKNSQDEKNNAADTTVAEKESVSQKVASVIGSGVGSTTSGLVSGASSIWNYGSSWISGGGSESSEKNSQDEKNNAADTTVAEKESVSQKVTSVIGSGVGSATSGLVSGASSIWNYGSSWISGGGSESSEKNSQDEKNHAADTTVAKNESVSQKVTSVIGSGVGSATSGLVSGASSIWNYGASLIRSSEEDKEKENEPVESVLSSLKSLFRPKALDKDEISVIDSGKQKEISSFPVTPFTGDFFWKDIVIPYAISAISGQLSERVASQSDEEDNKEDVGDDEILDEIDSPFFSKNVNREPYILPTTVAKFWTRVDGTLLSDWGPHVEGGYGLGFGIASPIDSHGGVTDGGQPYIVGHTGGAVGASSAMIIVPKKCNKEEPPKGIAVVLMCNLQSVSLNPLAIEIAKIFSLV